MSGNAKERTQGIKEAMQGTDRDHRCPDRRYRSCRERRRTSADTLVNHPDVVALVGLWSYNGPAILNAVRDAGKVGQVKIVRFDEEDETLAGVKEGARSSATVVQQPFEFGYQSISCCRKG